MSRLSDLYKAMEPLRKEGLPVNEDLEQKVNHLYHLPNCEYSVFAIELVTV